MRPHLVRVVHLARQLGVEEPHEVVELDARVARLSPVELGTRVVRAGVTGTNVVVQVIVVNFDVVVTMLIVESAFLLSAKERVDNSHWDRSESGCQLGQMRASHLICLLQVGEQLRGLLNAVGVLVGVVDELVCEHSAPDGRLRPTASRLYDFCCQLQGYLPAGPTLISSGVASISTWRSS